MIIEFLNLDGTFPVLDPFHAGNRGGVVRFIGEHDAQSLDSMRRVQGDFVHRDQLLQEKLNELVRAINNISGASDSVEGIVPIPLLPTSPANKNYVDTQDSEIATGIAIMAERLRSLKAMSTFSSDWVEVVWKNQTLKERIELTLTNLDESPITGLDFDQVVSSSLLIRADVASVGITDQNNAAEYVYRSATYGQSTGFKLDDIWLTPPDSVSVLIPYTSLFPSYPPSAGYNVSQPSRIWVKAVILTSQTPASSTTPTMPTLDFNNAEVQAIIAKAIEIIGDTANLNLTLPADNSDAFRRVVFTSEEGATGSSGGVLVNGVTLRFGSLPSAPKCKLVGLNGAGDLTKPQPAADKNASELRPLFLNSDDEIVIGDEPWVSYITRVPLLDDHSSPILYRNIEHGGSKYAARNIKVKLTPNASSPRPSWAKKVRVRLELAAHSSSVGGNAPNCGVRVLDGYDSLPVTSTDVLAQALVSWDYGGNVQMEGVWSAPYQTHTTAEAWITLQSDGSAQVLVQYLLHAKATTSSISWGLAVIRLLAYGR